MRVARRAAALLVLAFALTLAGGTVTLAATPSPSAPATSKVVTYTGSGVFTNQQHPEYLAEATNPPMTAVVDCTGTPCTVRVSAIDTSNGNVSVSLTGAQAIPLVAGSARAHIDAPASSLCSDTDTGPSAFTATATGDVLTVVFAFDTVGEVNCGDGSTVEGLSGYVLTGPLTAPAGTGCVVTGTCPTPTPSATASPAPAALRGDAEGPGSAPRAVTLAQPSTLSVLPTAAAALTAPNVIWAVAATVVLVLLIAFPSHLLNSATEAGTDRVSEWWKSTRERTRSRRREGAATAEPEAAAEPPAARAVDFAGWPLAAVGVLAASLISSFVDPSFGFNAASIRVFLSILLSFLLDAVLGWFLLILFVRRANPGATARFTFAPASLLIVVFAVLFTRLTGFAPGIVFGLVAGVAFGAIVATADKARQTIISLGYSFVLAIIGWAGYSAISASAGAHPAAPVVFFQETLSSMAIGGIAALPIALIPLRGMAGHAIFTWSRWVWGSAYALGLLGFFVVLMPKPFSWATVGLSVWTWAGIYAAYAITAVVLWLVITRPWKKDEPAPHADDTGALPLDDAEAVQA